MFPSPSASTLSLGVTQLRTSVVTLDPLRRDNIWIDDKQTVSCISFSGKEIGYVMPRLLIDHDSRRVLTAFLPNGVLA